MKVKSVLVSHLQTEAREGTDRPHVPRMPTASPTELMGMCAGNCIVYVLACIAFGVYMGRQASQTKIACVPTKLKSTCHSLALV